MWQWAGYTLLLIRECCLIPFTPPRPAAPLRDPAAWLAYTWALLFSCLVQPYLLRVRWGSILVLRLWSVHIGWTLKSLLIVGFVTGIRTWTQNIYTSATLVFASQKRFVHVLYESISNEQTTSLFYISRRANEATVTIHFPQLLPELMFGRTSE